jgi:hypothetical protein
VKLAAILTAAAVVLTSISGVLLVDLLHPAARSTSSVLREETCGPRSLWIAARRLGVPVDAPEVENLFRDGSTRGTTLADLRSAAVQVGLRARTTHADWDELTGKPVIAILFVSENHFVVVDSSVANPAHRDSVRIFDPDRLAVWMTKAELQAIWRGACLFLSANEIAPSDGPKVSLDRCYEDLGLVREMRTAAFQFSIRNLGTELLTVRVGNTTCSCTSAKLSEESIPSGTVARLDAIVNLERKEGRFNEVVILETNDPERPQLRFDLKGCVYRSHLLSTQRAHFGRIAPGSQTRFCVAVFDPGEKKLKVGDVLAVRDQGHSDSASRPECTVLKRAFQEVSEDDRLRLNLTSKDTMLEFVVKTPDMCIPGPFEIEYSIATNLPEAPSLPIIVEGSVLPDLVAEPAALVMSAPSSQGHATAKVTIRSLSRRAIPGLNVDRQSSLPTRITSSSTGHGYVDLEFSVEAPAAHRQGKIVCRCADGRKIEIPVLITSSQVEGRE